MVKITKGEIILTEEDYYSLTKKIIDGKTFYVYKSKQKNKKNENIIDKTIFENLFKEGKGFNKIVIEMNTTAHLLRKFMKETYDVKIFAELRQIIN